MPLLECRQKEFFGASSKSNLCGRSFAKECMLDPPLVALVGDAIEAKKGLSEEIHLSSHGLEMLRAILI